MKEFFVYNPLPLSVRIKTVNVKPQSSHSSSTIVNSFRMYINLKPFQDGSASQSFYIINFTFYIAFLCVILGLQSTAGQSAERI